MLFNNYILSYKYVSSHIDNIISYRNKIQINLNKVNNIKESSNSTTVFGSNNDISSISDISELSTVSVPSKDTQLKETPKYTNKNKIKINIKNNKDNNNSITNNNTINNNAINNNAINNNTINNNTINNNTIDNNNDIIDKNNSNSNSNNTNTNTNININDNNNKIKKVNIKNINNNNTSKVQINDEEPNLKNAHKEIQEIKKDFITDPNLESESESKSEMDLSNRLNNNNNNNNNHIYELLNTIHDNLNKIKKNNYDEHHLILKNTISVDPSTPSSMSVTNDTLTTSLDISSNITISSHQQQSLSDEIYSKLNLTPKNKSKRKNRNSQNTKESSVNSLYEISEISNLSDVSLYSNEKSSMESNFSFDNSIAPLSFKNSSDKYSEMNKESEETKSRKSNNKLSSNTESYDNDENLNITSYSVSTNCIYIYNIQ
ncbi:hypothetical protein PIROE2DRAFT_11404 [Piromyces sp. E2]|nr:hypothetical protein PIROE2DRAFT_11404 [Piromyces sp. E2]|eukprot:OUM62348.1 hypothetical protein PIROE2DRAFT_11404 [Piromyces sp. E2]